MKDFTFSSKRFFTLFFLLIFCLLINVSCGDNGDGDGGGGAVSEPPVPNANPQLRRPEGIALDVAGGKMYWTDEDSHLIQRSNLDGTSTEDLVTHAEGIIDPYGIALDVAGGKMYWTEKINGRIQRADLDGSNVESLVTGLYLPEGIALDVSGGKIYYTTFHRIQRANLDGSGVENVVVSYLNIGLPHDITLDVAGGKMYWTAPSYSVTQRTGEIYRADLTGTNVEILVNNLDFPESVALDTAGGMMYWSERDTGVIQRVAIPMESAPTLDGSSVSETVVPSLRLPRGVALDVAEGTMYWTEGGANKIQRADLDGSNLQAIFSGAGTPQDITVGGDNIYWIETGTERIYKAGVDGSNFERDFISGLEEPRGITLDVTGGKIYWTDFNTDKIHQANLDGTGSMELPTLCTDREITAAASFFLPCPNPNYRLRQFDVAVDGSKIYWTGTAGFTSVIRRADLDGSNVEAIISSRDGLRQPRAIAVGGGKIYWTDAFTEELHRSNLDGGNVDDDFINKDDGVIHPFAVALDVAGGKIYWTDGVVHKIQRANLDGSNVEDVYSDPEGLIEPYGLAVNEGKVYWLNARTHRVQRANLDGSNMEYLTSMRGWQR